MACNSSRSCNNSRFFLHCIENFLFFFLRFSLLILVVPLGNGSLHCLCLPCLESAQHKICTQMCYASSSPNASLLSIFFFSPSSLVLPFLDVRSQKRDSYTIHAHKKRLSYFAHTQFHMVRQVQF
jgi:hypothetical protein